MLQLGAQQFRYTELPWFYSLPSLLSPPLNKDRLKLRAFVYVVLGTAEGQKQPLRKTNHLPPYWTQTMPLVAHRKKRRGTVMCFEMFFVLIIFHCCDWAQWKQEFPPTPPALNPGRCRRSAENTLGYLTVITGTCSADSCSLPPSTQAALVPNRTTSSSQSIVILLLWGAIETVSCKVQQQMTAHPPWAPHAPSEVCHHLNFISRELYSILVFSSALG